MKLYLLVVLFFIASDLFADQTDTIIKLKTETGILEGSLMIPTGNSPVPVALIIAGSGPTDRDGNNPAMKNNSLKMLAEALSENGIATLRYDKRGIGKSQQAGEKESELRFEHYISDAKDWVALLNKDDRFSGVTIIGHSEGSLIGMVAAKESCVKNVISIAGPGLSADKVILEQIESQSPQTLTDVLPIIERLRQGKKVNDVNPQLYALFRPSVQPYMISWFKYDPAEEIAKLKMPVLIIQGLNDIQVSEAQAKMLAKANPNAQLKLVDGMNHIFKQSGTSRADNLASYNQPDLPINPVLTHVITDFVMQNEKQKFNLAHMKSCSAQ